MLAAMVRGLCEYQKAHLKEISLKVQLQPFIHITGRTVSQTMIRAKKTWMRDCDYHYEEESSMKGAAMLGRKYLEHSHL
ncbi:MAG TPA: hypothetical protein VMZ04_08200, partial [Anaerolineae bacterium]|nr:hypothetical protein [Anaerolineae bacterium]